MITTLVQFQLPAAITLEEAARRFEASAPKYQNLAGLIRKYYIRSEDGRIAGGRFRRANVIAGGAGARKRGTAGRHAAPGCDCARAWRHIGREPHDHLVRHSGHCR